MSRSYAGMGRLNDLEAVLEQERHRGASAP